MKKVLFLLTFISFFSCETSENVSSEEVNSSKSINSTISMREVLNPDIKVGGSNSFKSESEGTLSLYIDCSYFSAHSGQSTGYGHDTAGNLYYYWTVGFPRVYYCQKVKKALC